MIVRFVGFNLTPADSYSIDQFMHDLAARPISWSDENGPGRFLFIDNQSDDDYYLGLVATVKDQRRFCQLQENGTDALEIVVNEPDQTKRLMEFNFFVVNRITNIGLYQHYHQSCSLREGMKVLGQHYRDYLQGYREAHVTKLVGEGVSQHRAESAARNHYKGSLKYTQLISPADLETMLDELSNISSLELEYSTLRVQQTAYTQLSNFAKKETHKVVFNRQNGVGKRLIDAIMSSINAKSPDSGRVIGTDESGWERIIRIDSNPYTFGEFDFDEVAAKIHQLNIKQFGQSWVVGQLLSICRERQELFETESQ